MKNKIWLCGILLSLFSANTIAQDAAKVDALTKRIEELEKKQEEFQFQLEPKSKVSSFLNNNLTLGGFFESGYTVIKGEDTDFQSGTTNILALNVSAEFDSGFKFIGQFVTGLFVPLVNEDNNPNVSAPLPTERRFANPTFSTLLTQGILEYSVNRGFNVQGGMGYTSFGYAFQERELVLFHRRGGPQILRSGLTPFWEGLHVHGSFNSGENFWGYNAYTFSPPKKVEALGMGGRLWWASADRNIVAGTSTQVAKSQDGVTETMGADLKVDFFPFSVRSELSHQNMEGVDPWSVYVEPSVTLFDEKFLFYVFGDYLSNPQNLSGTINDPVQKWEYGGGVNYLPTSYTRLRLGATYNDYVGGNFVVSGVQRDYWSFDISAGVAF